MSIPMDQEPSKSELVNEILELRRELKIKQGGIKQITEQFEQLQADNKILHKALNDQLPHTMIACPECGLYGIRASKQNMCDKCEIKRLREALQKIWDGGGTPKSCFYHKIAKKALKE